MVHSVIPVEAIRERDIDLILLEELSTDVSFCQWFVQELNLPSFTKTDGAWISISDFGLGETGIVFSYFSGNKKIVLLIENKLDASFQEEQYDRYAKRAKEYKFREMCDDAYSILTAPNQYCQNQNDFESFISYEAISQRFISTGSKRNLFKSQLLTIAIEKLRRGYQPIHSQLEQKFWIEYWKYKEEHYPNFRMKKPGIVPFNSDWPMLYGDQLTNIIFRHKFGQGNVDTTFRGLDVSRKNEIQDLLPDHIKLVEHVLELYHLEFFQVN